MSKKMFAVSKSVKFVASKAETFNLGQDVGNLLAEYGHVAPNKMCGCGLPHGLQKMYGDQDGIYWKNKGWMLDIFKNHPDYDGAGRIIFKDVTVKRYVNPDYYHGKFQMWVYENLNDSLEGMYSDYAKYLGVKKLVIYILNKFGKAIDEAADAYQEEPLLLSNGDANYLNTIGKFYGLDFRFTGGKLSKNIQKFGKVFGLDKIKNMKTIRYTVDGEERTKAKDFGWNYQFATLSDTINPCEWHYHWVLSVNPLDFYTMSFGDNWASCHTIDKDNRRFTSDTTHQYHGMYCGGCESYALDRSTMIFYYVDSKATLDKDIYKVDKCKRVVMYFNGSTLVTSRLYPDGRDGSHFDRTKDQIINLVQNALADAMGVARTAWGFREDDIWGARKYIKTATCASHYEDYDYYRDIVTTHLVTNEGINNNIGMLVGYTTVCPTCGTEVYEHDELSCEDCRPVKCGCCGQLVSRDTCWSDDYNDEYVCEDCFVGTCSECGSIVTTQMDYIFDDDGELVCNRCFANCEDCGTAHRIDDMHVLRMDRFSYCTRYICDECIKCNDDYVITEDNGVTTRLCARTDTDGDVWAAFQVSECAECGGYHLRGLYSWDIEAAHERMRRRGQQMLPQSRVHEQEELPEYLRFDNVSDDEEVVGGDVDEYGFAIIHDED